MSDELLEFLGIAAGGIAIYLVAQNNAPAIKKAVSSIPAVSNIIPVSTRAPQDDRAPAPRGTCPPGYSPDYTMGVMHCHDSHGTRELNPNVKMFNPQWQNAWGDEGWASPPLIPTPSQTLAPPKPEPQTLREPSRIISSVNPQIKKSEEQRKRQEEKDKKVHTQVECPKDLSKMKCGSNCYKNGKLYKIVCSEAEREALYPPKKTKKKSITVPANFPGDVTISPGETPYPEVGDEPGGQDVPLTDLLPGQKQILPTIPETTPGRGPTATTPAQIITPGKPVGQATCGKCNHKDPWDSCRCAIGSECDGKKSTEDGGQDGVKVSDLIHNSPSFYAVWTFHAPNGFTPHGVNGAEVTGAYCGSNNNLTTVGITIGVHADGSLKTRTEDHYNPTGHHQRASGDYMDLASGVGIKSVPGFGPSIKDFTIIWCADKDASGVLYRGYLKIGNGREIQIANIKNPPEGGNVAGGHHDSRTKVIDFTKQPNTYMRGRIDGAGLHATMTGTLYPGHYTSGSGFYYSGPYGYMLENDGYF